MNMSSQNWQDPGKIRRPDYAPIPTAKQGPGTSRGDEEAEALAAAENDYWRQNLESRPYYDPSLSFAEYEPALTYGRQTRSHYVDREWDDVEEDIRNGWDSARGKSLLAWDKAKLAIRDAWDRLTNADEREAESIDGKRRLPRRADLT